MAFKLSYESDVIQDLSELPDDVLVEVRDYFAKYISNPYKYSQPLSNKLGMDLSECRKTYVANATYRIIIHIQNDTIKVVNVIAVGKRNLLEAYLKAFQRLNT